MERKYQFDVPAGDNRLRVDEFLASRLGGLSRMQIARLLSEGACLLNGINVNAGKRLNTGDKIHVTIPDYGPSAMTPDPTPLDIVFEDPHIIVLLKPSGMLVHPTLGVKNGTLANALTYHLNRKYFDDNHETGSEHHRAFDLSLTRPGIIHRLDKCTSGLIVAAKTSHALSVLTRHFRKRLIEKVYSALVHGDIETPEDIIEAPIGRDPDSIPRWWVMATGRPAQTRYRVVDRYGEYTLLDLEPLTGRTNQIRIHCAYINHPIAGDPQYSPSPPSELLIKPFSAKSPRLFLHASRLAFHHPETGDWLEFRSSLPPDLQIYLDIIRQTD